MLRRIAKLFVSRLCPSCDAPLRTQDGGFSSCRCGVVVVPERGGWRFGGEQDFRPLPGLAGRFYREDAA